MMLLEVAALRTPVVCSDILENTDVFSADEMLFFKSEDYSDLAGKLELALKDLERMKSSADRAYKSLVENYLWSDIVVKYESIFKEVIQS